MARISHGRYWRAPGSVDPSIYKAPGRIESVWNWLRSKLESPPESRGLEFANPMANALVKPTQLRLDELAKMLVPFVEDVATYRASIGKSTGDLTKGWLQKLVLGKFAGALQGVPDRELGLISAIRYDPSERNRDLYGYILRQTAPGEIFLTGRGVMNDLLTGLSRRSQKSQTRRGLLGPRAREFVMSQRPRTPENYFRELVQSPGLTESGYLTPEPLRVPGAILRHELGHYKAGIAPTKRAGETAADFYALLRSGLPDYMDLELEELARDAFEGNLGLTTEQAEELIRRIVP